MCIHIKCRFLGVWMVVLLGVWCQAGCGMTDDSAQRTWSLGEVAQGQEDGDSPDADTYETREGDPLRPGASEGGLPRLPGFPQVLPECSGEGGCPGERLESGWCGDPSGCKDRCAEGSDAAAQGDECVCAPQNEGVEMCDGNDDDCDGIVDNIYADGHLAARGDLTCVTSRAGELRCFGGGEATGVWPATQARLGQVSAGRGHGCAVGADAQVYCWGDNHFGQALPGGAAFVSAPTRVELNADIVKVDSGADHSCALSTAGEVYCWGRNQYSQLGVGTSVPVDGAVEIEAVLDFVDLSLGADHACAATRDGRMLCWGANHFGQTAQGDFDAINVPSWVDIPDYVTQVSAGAAHTCALTEQERIYCWGNNEQGQLGDGTTTSRMHPRVAGEEVLFKSVTAGGSRTCALRGSGRVYCWGDNQQGSLGVDGVASSYLEPTPAAGALEFSEIRAGGRHICGLTLRGYLQCWGRGQDGQLGGGAQTQQRRPRRVDCR